MRPYYCFLLGVWLLLMPFLGARAKRNEEAYKAFKQGNEHYRSQQFEKALAAYRKAQKAGLTTTALYFNQGNTFYRLQRFGEARLAYERARHLTPNDPRIEHNIHQLKRQLADSFPERPAPFWTRWWKRALQRWGLLQFFLVGLALYLGGLILVGLRLFMKTAKSWRSVLSGVLLSSALLFFGASFLASWQQAHPHKAVIVASKATLRNRPGGGNQAAVAHPGVLLDVIDTDNSWRRVALPNGKMGWLPKSSIKDV